MCTVVRRMVVFVVVAGLSGYWSRLLFASQQGTTVSRIIYPEKEARALGKARGLFEQAREMMNEAGRDFLDANNRGDEAGVVDAVDRCEKSLRKWGEALNDVIRYAPAYLSYLMQKASEKADTPEGRSYQYKAERVRDAIGAAREILRRLPDTRQGIAQALDAWRHRILSGSQTEKMAEKGAMAVYEPSYFIFEQCAAITEGLGSPGELVTDEDQEKYREEVEDRRSQLAKYLDY